jgi:hypothetical protein
MVGQCSPLREFYESGSGVLTDAGSAAVDDGSALPLKQAARELFRASSG